LNGNRVEFLPDPENKIVRPRQNYQGAKRRDFVEPSFRVENNFFLESTSSQRQKRREAANRN
jgi:citrate synthase